MRKNHPKNHTSNHPEGDYNIKFNLYNISMILAGANHF